MRLIFAFLVIYCSSVSQNSLESYIQKNAVEIRSLNFNDTSYDDLKPLGEAIGDRQIVMLGEMWHGDGATFEAKSRIIRFLHEKHNFNVLAFESDFYSLTKGFEQYINTRTNYDSLVRNNIFSYWSHAAQCTNLFRYTEIHPTLTICGIDNQLKGQVSQTHFKADSREYINKSGIEFLMTSYYKNLFWVDFDSVFDLVSRYSFKNRLQYNKNTLYRLGTAIDTVLVQAARRNPAINDFNYVSLQNFRSLCDMFVNLEDFNKASSIRDAQMSRNLEWLTKTRFHSEKIIVWLASSHMVKDNQTAYAQPSKQPSMGYFFTQNKTNPLTFVIGFTSDNGRGYAIGNMKYSIPKTKPTSIESAFKKVNKKLLFVSIAGYTPEREKEYYHSKIDGGNNVKAQWHKSVDGVFYIETMTPATKR